MKKLILLSLALLIVGYASAQPGQRRQLEPLPDGFKPASTNTFLSQYPAVNPETPFEVAFDYFRIESAGLK